MFARSVQQEGTNESRGTPSPRCHPSPLGVFEASLEARDCGCRAVVCICTEASELLNKKGSILLLLPTVGDQHAVTMLGAVD